MDRRELITTLGAGAVGLTLAGCSQLGEEGPAADEPGNETDDEFDLGDIGTGEVQAPEEVRVTESHLVRRQDEVVGVLGMILNTSDQRLEFVEVTATIYDRDENVIDQIFDNTEEEELDGLAAGAVWDFEIWFTDAEPSEINRYTLNIETDVADQGITDDGQQNGTQTTGAPMNQTQTQ